MDEMDDLPTAVPAPTPPLFDVTVGEIRQQAVDVTSFELVEKGGESLPAFTAGAHIDLHLPGGMIRSYSLLNEQSDRHRYVIAVRKETSGRGGSLFMHNRMSPGSRVTISEPKNHFPLVEDAPHVLFIAGGIGITPIWSMVQRLEKLGRSWTLHYCVRTREHAAFYNELMSLQTDSPRIHFHFDGGRPELGISMESVIAQAQNDAHLYCCGPSGMLASFQQCTANLPASQIHTEYFSGAISHAELGGFQIELARSGKTLTIERGQSILDAIVLAGIDAPHSCKEGVCGNCETAIIEGVADHRDLVLTADERASGKTMMICCSGCVGDRLVLDL